MEETEVLSLGLGFCPDQGLDLFETIKDINLFARKLTLKILHYKETNPNKGIKTLMNLKKSECRELFELLTSDSEVSDSPPNSPTHLLDCELDLIDEIDFESILDLEESSTPDLSKFKKKSSTYPSMSINKNIHLFLKKVTQDILELPTRKDLPNNLTGS